jgi:pyruvate kinase
MKKHTKIIATIGPASSHPEILLGLHEAGMNAARINMSHGDHAQQAEYIKRIRQLNENFPILLDTRGPEIRTGRMLQSPLQVSAGDLLRLRHTDTRETPDILPVDYPYLNELTPGMRILFDDGLVESEVVENRGDDTVIRISTDGPIGPGKKVTIQGYHVQLPFLTEQDQSDILFAIENHIRLVAASFVRCADDIRDLKSFINEHGADMRIIAKIEHSDAVANLDEILEAADGIMVARGDLGVELPLQEIPGIQKKIIQKCNQAGKPVIVATQMLESMRDNPRPTRAEVNDVAHAILQGADAIMLSAETATGAYPMRSVEMMSLISSQYEKDVKGVIKNFRRKEERGHVGIAPYIAKAAYYASRELDVAAILTPTESGFTARNVSRFKPRCPILAITGDAAVVQLLHLVRGVSPVLDTASVLKLNHYEMSYMLIHQFYESGILSLEDRIIITSGSNLLSKRGTNLLEIYAVKDIIQDKKGNDLDARTSAGKGRGLSAVPGPDTAASNIISLFDPPRSENG